MKHFLQLRGAGHTLFPPHPTGVLRRTGTYLGILLTGVLAALSGGYAVYVAVDSVAVALVLGLLWGALLLAVDCAIVLGAARQQPSWAGILRTALRLVLAALAAVVIARPLQLRLFQPEIERQIARSRIERRARLAADVHTDFGARRSEVRSEIVRLQLEVDSARRALADRAWSGKTEELSFAPTISVDTPPSPALLRAQAAARRRLDELEARNSPRIERGRGEIARLRGEEERALALMDRNLPARDGLRARLGALRALERRSETVRRADLLMILMFVSIQTAPLLLPLLQQRSDRGRFGTGAAPE